MTDTTIVLIAATALQAATTAAIAYIHHRTRKLVRENDYLKKMTDEACVVVRDLRETLRVTCLNYAKLSTAAKVLCNYPCRGGADDICTLCSKAELCAFLHGREPRRDELVESALAARYARNTPSDASHANGGDR